MIIHISDAIKHGALLKDVTEFIKARVESFAKLFPKAAKGIYNLGTFCDLYERMYYSKMFSDEELMDMYKMCGSKTCPAFYEYVHNAMSLKQKFQGLYFNGTILKNRSTLELYIEKWEYDVTHNYHPTNCHGFRGILDHELGHVLEDYIGNKIIENSSIAKWSIETKKKVSIYGASNIHELMAEGFASCLGEDPSTQAIEIGRFLKKTYLYKTTNSGK